MALRAIYILFEIPVFFDSPCIHKDETIDIYKDETRCIPKNKTRYLQRRD